jgi:hypothetical protein
MAPIFLNETKPIFKVLTFYFILIGFGSEKKTGRMAN